MQDWSSDKVLALAPDAGSASAGQALASLHKWSSLGATDRAIWGQCQGSGKDPYLVRIDQGEPAFKCSCPSRKFPCKHGLALLLLFVKARASFGSTTEPEWVSAWIDTRGQAAEKKATKSKAAAAAPPDAETLAKRAASREQRVRDGVIECQAWLDDLIRRGLASAQADAAAECERVAARMIDAQAAGLAHWLREVPRLVASGAGWERRTLEHLGQLHLLLVAAHRLSELPEALAGDVRVALGYNQSKEDALAQAGVMDRWTIVGQAFERSDRLTARRSWLWGARTTMMGLVVDFAIGDQAMDASLVPGTAFEGEVAFHPSGAPLRALVKSRGDCSSAEAPRSDPTQNAIADGLEQFAKALGANPWLMRWPMVLPRTSVVRSGSHWLLHHDAEVLPLSRAFQRSPQLWRLIAATGGRDATIVVEWDGDCAEPVGAFLDSSEARYISLACFTDRWSS